MIKQACLAIVVTTCWASEIAGLILEDHSGQPVRKAIVRIVNTQGAVIAELESNANGEFRNADLGAGEYRIDVSKKGYLPAIARFVPQGAAARRSSFSIRLLRHGSISGCITGVDAGRVVAISVSGVRPPVFAVAARQAGTDTVGACYRLTDLSPGKYWLGLHSTQRGHEFGQGLMLFPSSQRPQEFTVYGGEQYDRIDFHGPFGTTFGIAIKTPHRGKALSFALISAHQPAPLLIKGKISSEDFTFDGVFPGDYFILVRGEVPTGASYPLWGRVRVTLQANVDNLEIPMRPGQNAIVRVHPDETGSRVCSPDWKVVLRPEVWPPDGSLVSTGRLEAAVRFDGLAPVRYRVFVGSSNETCHNHASVVDGAAEQPQRIAVAVSRPDSVRARVVGGKSGLCAVYVVALDDAAPLRVAIGPVDSDFVFDDLPPGRYYVAADPHAGAGGRWAPLVGSEPPAIVAHGGQSHQMELRVVPRDKTAR